MYVVLLFNLYDIIIEVLMFTRFDNYNCTSITTVNSNSMDIYYRVVQLQSNENSRPDVKLEARLAYFQLSIGRTPYVNNYLTLLDLLGRLCSALFPHL